VTTRTASTNNSQQHLPPDVPLIFQANSARDRVRIDEGREVTQMLKLFTFAQAAAESLRRREEGQTMAEYGVVLAVICLAVVVAITALSGGITSAIDSVTAILPG